MIIVATLLVVPMTFVKFNVHRAATTCGPAALAEGISCLEHIQQSIRRGSNLSSAAHDVAAAFPTCGPCVEASALALARQCTFVELSAATPAGDTCGDLMIGALLESEKAESGFAAAHDAVLDAWPLACACTAEGDACDTPLAGDSTCRTREATLLRESAEAGPTMTFVDARLKIAAEHPRECRPCATASGLVLDPAVDAHGALAADASSPGELYVPHGDDTPSISATDTPAHSASGSSSTGVARADAPTPPARSSSTSRASKISTRAVGPSVTSVTSDPKLSSTSPPAPEAAPALAIEHTASEPGACPSAPHTALTHPFSACTP